MIILYRPKKKDSLRYKSLWLTNGFHYIDHPLPGSKRWIETNGVLEYDKSNKIRRWITDHSKQGWLSCDI